MTMDQIYAQVQWQTDCFGYLVVVHPCGVSILVSLCDIILASWLSPTYGRAASTRDAEIRFMIQFF